MARRWDPLRRIFVEDFDGSLYQLRSERGQPNGYPPLGPDGDIPPEYLPPDLGGGGSTVIAGPLVTHGVKFEWISSTTVRLVPAGIEDTCRIAVVNDSGDFLYISISSPITWNTTSGFQPGTTKLASNGYEIFLEVRSDGTGARLSANLNENPQVSSPGYSFRSATIGFVSLDTSGLIRPFAMQGLDYWYSQDLDLILFGAYTGTAHRTLDVAQFMPTIAGAAYTYMSWHNDSPTTKDFNVNSKTTFGEFVRVAGGDIAVEAGTRRVPFEIPLLNGVPSNIAEYFWEAVPSGVFGGASLFMIGFRFRDSIGETGGAGELGGGETVVQITPGTDLDSTPDPITGIGTINHANSGATAGTYGSSTMIPVITVNVRGHITAAAQVAAAGGGGGGSGTVTNIATSSPVTGGPITTTGTIGLEPASAGTLLGRAIGAGTGAPTYLSQGTGGGVDTDKVDGLHSSSFVRTDANSTVSGFITNWTGGGELQIDAGANIDVNGACYLDDATLLTLPPFNISGAGSGSDLDADKLDGHDSSVTPAASKIPVSDASGTLNDWIDDLPGSALDDPLTVNNLNVAANVTVLGGGTTLIYGDMQILTNNLAMPSLNITGAGSGSGLDADKLDGHNSATAGGTASTVPVTDSGGKLPASFGGSASTLATLNSSSKVVEDPANATATPTANKIPIADGSGLLDSWVTTNAPQLSMAGGRFVFNTVSTVDLQVTGVDAKARIPLYDGSTWKTFVITSTVTANIASSGANGLDTGSEAASTFYHLFGIGKSDGTFALLLSTSATSPTMPAGYTYKRLLWGVANCVGGSSSDFASFIMDSTGFCRYTEVPSSGRPGVFIVSAGSATTTTAIDMRKAVPAVDKCRFTFYEVSSNNSATGSQYNRYVDSGATQSVLAKTLGTNVNFNVMVLPNTDWYVNGAGNTTYWYKWSVNTSQQALDFLVTGWQLGNMNVN